MAIKKAVKNQKPMRTALLDAAVDLVEEFGAGLLTLDAVAARAGVSKGGLLHHFKSKDALLVAMIARVAEAFENERQIATEVLAAHVGDTTQYEVEMMMHYLDRAFAGLGTGNHSAMPLLAAAAHQPNLLQPIRDYFERRTQEILKHSGSPKALLTVMLLADGLWLFDAIGIPPVTGKLRNDLHHMIRIWSQQAIEADGRAAAATRAETPVEPQSGKTAASKTAAKPAAAGNTTVGKKATRKTIKS